MKIFTENYLAEIKKVFERESFEQKVKMLVAPNKAIIGGGLFFLIISPVLFSGKILLFIEENNFLTGSARETEYYKNERAAIFDKKTDIDGDGLPDTVEIIIGTDTDDSDTDGDSYKDPEEIKNGYSPIIGGGAGKLSAEDLEALGEKIKSADEYLYEKIFGKFDNPNSLRDSSVGPITSPPLAVLLSGPAVSKEEIFLSNKNWKYSFYAPADIDLNKGQTLLIGLHGFDDKAKDFVKLWQADADKNSFLIAALQAYSKTYPSGATVESYPWLEISDFAKAAISDIEKRYKIDNDKIFLTGYSAGASASYIVALDSGVKFKGVIPIDGYLPLEAGILDKLSKARKVNFYVVHGANDDQDKAAISQEKILLQYGAKMEFKTLPGLSREYPAAEHENIMEWMKGLM